MADTGGEQLIPLFDIDITESQIDAVAATLRSGWLTMGPRTSEFEEAFAARLGVRHAVALSSGTAALHLSYLAAGIGPGDEVIVPAVTFVASAAAVRYCGATAVPADVVGDHDFGLDVPDVESRITDRTKAVCVVHYGGYQAATSELRALCRERGLVLIEDSAHHPLAQPVGLVGCFSFFSNKVLSCGEGGLLATDDDDVAAFARSRRSHALTSGTWDRHRGHAPGYDVTALGYNYRLDEPRAALLCARLEGLDADIERRRQLVHAYRELLAPIEGVSTPYLPEEVDRSSCYVMPTTLSDAGQRDPVRQFMMDERHVQTSVLYPAFHEFTAYADTAGPLPRSESIARTQLTLPLYPHMSDADQNRVVAALRDGLAATAGEH